jgi:hypothetical protein
VVLIVAELDGCGLGTRGDLAIRPSAPGALALYALASLDKPHRVSCLVPAPSSSTAWAVSYERAPFTTDHWQDIASNVTHVTLQGGTAADGGDASSPAPPDLDADQTPDTDDSCPSTPGRYNNSGCP